MLYPFKCCLTRNREFIFILQAPKAISSVQSQPRTALANAMPVKGLPTESQFTMSPLMMYIDSELSNGRSSTVVKNRLAGISGVVTGNCCTLYLLVIMNINLFVFGFILGL